MVTHVNEAVSTEKTTEELIEWRADALMNNEEWLSGAVDALLEPLGHIEHHSEDILFLDEDLKTLVFDAVRFYDAIPPDGNLAEVVPFSAAPVVMSARRFWTVIRRLALERAEEDAEFLPEWYQEEQDLTAS